MQLQMVQLTTANLAPQRAFWVQLLGCELVDEHETAFAVQVGHTRLMWMLDSTLSATYHYALKVSPNHAADAEAWLIQHRSLLTSSDGQTHFAFDEWQASSIYFADPDGNIAEIIHHHEDAPAVDSFRGATSLVSVSEVGMVTPDVPALVARLRTHYDLDIYRDTQSDSFAAMGDREGLLIVVKQGRGWWPTLMPASPAPLSLHWVGQRGAMTWGA
jgi:catechol-2,3-dioxygenase